jgi:hypothetical protein
MVFGQLTAMTGLPTSGTASYTGVATGLYSTATDNYNLTGTSTLNANFANQTMSTSLVLNGAGIATGQSLALGTYSGTSAIASLNGSAAFAGVFSNATNALLSGKFAGNFYGPAAAEFGYTFTLKEVNAAGAILSVGGGVAVGH